jgi:hypothetical protein
MARGRMLNKSISYNKDVALLTNELGADAGLVFTWIIAHLDREGRFHGDEDVIKGTVFPRIAGILPAIIRKTLARAAKLELVVWYEVDGEKYLYYPGFDRQQIGIRKDREPRSDFPSPDSGVAVCIHEASGQLPDSCRQPSGNLTDEGSDQGSDIREGSDQIEDLAPSCSQDEHSTHDVKERRIAEVSLVASTPEIVSSAVLGIPLVNGEEHKITQADVADWSRDFPAVDVMQELRKLRQWNISRPKNRKTARGIRAHITSWLSKAQDRGGAMSPTALRRFTSRQEESMAAALAATEVHNDRIEELERESTNVVRATGGGPIRALPERIDAVDDNSHVVESPTRLVRACSHHGARESTSS